MTFLLRWLLSLVLLVCLALAFVSFTAKGSRAALHVVERILPVEIEYSGGKFSQQLRLRRLGYRVEGLKIESSDVVIELSPQCLWRSVICFEKLQIAQLDISLLQEATEAQAEQAVLEHEEDADLIKFPVALESKSLTIASTRIQWNDGEWRQGPAQVSLSVNGSTVEILAAAIREPHLELRESAEANVVESNIIKLPHIDLPVNLEVAKLHLQQPSWSLFGVEHQYASINLQGNWRNTQLQLRQLQIDSIEWGELSLQGKMDFSANWPVAASLDAALAQPPVWAALHGRSAAVSMQGDLGALSLQLSVPDVHGLLVNAEVNVTDRQLPFTATASTSSTESILLAQYQEIPGVLAKYHLEPSLQFAATGSLAEQAFELQAAAGGPGVQSLQLSLQGRHSMGRVTIEDVLLHDIARESALRGSGEISLGEQLDWSMLLQTAGLQLPQVSEYIFGSLQGSMSLQGSFQDEFWTMQVVDVALQGEVNSLPARITGFAGLDSEMRLLHSKLEAELNGAQLSLQSFDDAGRASQLQLNIDQLGRWQPGARGRLSVQAEFPGDAGHFEFSGVLQDLEWAELTIKSGTIAGRYSRQNEQAFNIDTGLTDVVAAGFGIDALQLTATGNTSQQSLSLVSRGDLQGELSLQGWSQGDHWQGRVEPTQLQTSRGIWQLQDAVAMTWPGPARQLVVQGHCWTQQGTRICPGELLLGQRGQGSLEMTGDMTFLSAFLPQNITLTGELQLQLEGSWNPDQGTLVQGSSRTRAVVLTQNYGEGDIASIGWDAGDARFSYNHEGLQIGWQLQRGGRDVLELELILPPERGAALAGTAGFNGMQLATLAPFLPSLSRFEGTLSGQLQLAGTVDKPLAHGVLRLNDGHLAVIGNPTELQGLDLTLDLRGDRAKIAGVGLLGGGELRLAGQFVYQPEYRLQLSIEGENHSILYPPSTELRISEKLQLVATKGYLDITGELEVHQGMLEFEQLPEGSVAVSADVVEVDYTGNVIRQELPFDISMDVRATIHDNFKVTGSLLETTLGGRLHLQQQRGEALQLFGSLHAVGGEVHAYQQRLQLKRGTITFSGAPSNPMLDVRAQREISRSNILVGLQVRGRLNQELMLEVYSEPDMPSREALSYLVRGRGMDEGAAADGTALALSMAGGVLNRTAIVSELNRIPGVSNVEFGAEGSEEEAVGTVSGYIGERIYLSYGIGLYEPINVLTARYYLRPRLWLEVVSRLENSIDLYYSFDLE